jgi:hypothetical protein
MGPLACLECTFNHPPAAWFVLFMRAAVPAQLSLVKAASHPGFAHIPYLHTPKSVAKVKAVTHLVVADLAQPRGRSLLAAALEWVIEDEGGEAAAGRLGLVLAPAKEPSVLDALVLLVAEVRAAQQATLMTFQQVTGACVSLPCTKTLWLSHCRVLHLQP